MSRVCFLVSVLSLLERASLLAEERRRAVPAAAGDSPPSSANSTVRVAVFIFDGSRTAGDAAGDAAGDGALAVAGGGLSINKAASPGTVLVLASMAVAVLCIRAD